MFDKMRKNAKIIIYFIAAAFVISMAIGGVSSIFTQKQSLGEIAGERISYKQFNELLKQNYANYQQQYPDKEIDERTMKQLNDQTWNQLVQRILYDKQIKKRDIEISDEDIVKELQNPSANIKNIEQFKTDGKFDYSKYEETVINNPQFSSMLEENIKQTLPYKKLLEDVKSEVVVTEEKKKKKYTRENNKADAKIIFFSPKNIKNVEVSEAEIENYYEENKEEYKKEPARKFKYVKFTLEPSEKDKADAKTKIDSVHTLIKNGADFAEMAEEYSEGPSASKGGDLGYFGKGRMVKKFEEVAFNLEKGEVSEPVQTRFGWHIIKLYDSRTSEQGEPEIKASHILVKAEASETTKQNLKLKVEDFYIMAQEQSLEKAAENLSKEVEETREFYESSSYISGIGRNEELVEFAFSHDKGEMTKPTQIRDKDWVIAAISYQLGEHYDSLEEVKSRIERELEQEKKTELVHKKAEAFVNKYDKSAWFEQAETDSLEIIEAEEITVDKPLPTIRKNEKLANAILSTEATEFTSLITDDKGAYIAYVEKRMKPDMEKFEKQKQALIEKIRKEKENEYVREWYNELKENAEIIDNRDEYYSL